MKRHSFVVLLLVIIFAVATITFIIQDRPSPPTKVTPSPNLALSEISKAKQEYEDATTSAEKREIAKEILKKYKDFPVPDGLEPFMAEIKEKN